MSANRIEGKWQRKLASVFYSLRCMHMPPAARRWTWTQPLQTMFLLATTYLLWARALYRLEYQVQGQCAYLHALLCSMPSTRVFCDAPLLEDTPLAYSKCSSPCWFCFLAQDSLNNYLCTLSAVPQRKADCFSTSLKLLRFHIDLRCYHIRRSCRTFAACD